MPAGRPAGRGAKHVRLPAGRRGSGGAVAPGRRSRLSAVVVKSEIRNPASPRLRRTGPKSAIVPKCPGIRADAALRSSDASSLRSTSGTPYTAIIPAFALRATAGTRRRPATARAVPVPGAKPACGGRVRGAAPDERGPLNRGVLRQQGVAIFRPNGAADCNHGWSGAAAACPPWRAAARRATRGKRMRKKGSGFFSPFFAPTGRRRFLGRRKDACARQFLRPLGAGGLKHERFHGFRTAR